MISPKTKTKIESEVDKLLAAFKRVSGSDRSQPDQIEIARIVQDRAKLWEDHYNDHQKFLEELTR